VVTGPNRKSRGFCHHPIVEPPAMPVKTAQRWPPQPQGRVAEPGLRRPKKPAPVCNAPDMPTSGQVCHGKKACGTVSHWESKS
jgi:hypothetical protein